MVVLANLSVNLSISAPEGAVMRARRSRIGVIAPFDMALDREYWDLAPAGVSIHFTRLDIVDLPYGPEHARAVADPAGLRAASRTLVRIDPDVVAFACTSASFVDGLDGEARIRAAIEGAGVAHATTASGALVECLRERGIRRVALGTPYEDALGERLRAFLGEAGFEPGSLVNLGYTDEEAVIGAPAEVVAALARASLFPGAEAVFLACTNLPTVGILDRLSGDLGVPVLSANQVLMEASVRRVDRSDAGRVPADLRA
jgi:maleate isomerase